MQDQTDIVVISLKRAVERRFSIEKQLSEMGLTFRFFDAVDGKLGHELFSKYDAKKARLIGEIPLSDGHLGCYASHYLVWQQCMESGKPMIVLEDDALFYKAQFLRFLKYAPQLPAEIESVRLFESKSRNKTHWPVYCIDGLSIGKFLRGHKSATGYYLTPSAARKFLKHGQQWAEPVDIEMDQFWANGVECFGVLEPCLTHNPEFQSAIDEGVDTAKARRGFMRFRWRVYMLAGKIVRNIHNLRYKTKLNARS